MEKCTYQFFTDTLLQIGGMVNNISWPLFALIAFFLLRTEIKKLVKRIVKLGPDGAEFREEQKQGVSLKEYSNIGKNDSVAAHNVNSSSNNTFTDVINFVRNSPALCAQVKRINDDIRGKYSDLGEQQLIECLIAEYALLSFRSWANLQYIDMLGSQIKLLEELNKIDRGFSIPEMESYFQTVKSQHSELKTWDMNAYIKFLLNNGSVIFKDDRYVITDLGREFMNWLNSTGLTKNKPL